MARLVRLEFNFTLQLDNSFELQHHNCIHYNDHFLADDDDDDDDDYHDNHCSYGNNWIVVQWIVPSVEFIWREFKQF